MERDATSKHMRAGLAQVMQISRRKSSPKIKEDSLSCFLIKKIILFVCVCIYLGGPVLGLCRCAGFSPESASQGCSNCGARASLTAVGSPVQSTASGACRLPQRQRVRSAVSAPGI